MIPNTLDEWSVQAVIELLTKGTFESEEFDFKERLPDPADNNGKKRLRKACAAFANSEGGFLIFGISDDKTRPPADRLVGIDSDFDFPERFGNFPKACVPSIEWSFKNPPVVLDSGKVLHTVYVPRSWKAPHAVGSANEGWEFQKRTNKGDEGMSMEEIRSAFLGFYEKRLRLQLLRGELTSLKNTASDASITDPNKIESSYSLVTFDVGVIESLIGDTYSITASSPDLIATLSELRQQVRVANNENRIFFGVVKIPLMTSKADLIREHNEFMAKKCTDIMDLSDRAISQLAPLLGN